MSDSWESVQLWRCQGCGKWSHAKKQPKKHQRWVREGEPEFDPARGEGAVYDHQGSLLAPDAHAVDCGPFKPFVASPGRLR